MITYDDRLFCLLYSAEDGINIGRLNCYTYILQKLGLSLDYHFRVNVSGVRSKSFSRYLEEQVSLGTIVQKSGTMMLTNDSRFTLENFILSYDNLESLDKIRGILNNLTDEELYMICIIDIIIEDIIKTKGLDALVTSRDFIEKSVENLCSEYTKENFNLAIYLIKKLKKECLLNE